MIDFSIQFQAAVFGSYEDISPTPETIRFFLDSFTEMQLIPATTQEPEVFNNKLRNVNRLGLRSSDNVWNIEFNSNRINFVKNNMDVGVSAMGEIKEFLADVKKITEKIHERFPKKHHRIALVTRYMLKKMTREEMNVLYSKSVIPIDFYKEHPPVNWYIRSIGRFTNVVEKEETINAISELSHVSGNAIINSKNEPLDRIEIKFDINTWPGDAEYRFEQSQIEKFLNIAASTEEKLKSEYLKLLS